MGHRKRVFLGLANLWRVSRVLGGELWLGALGSVPVSLTLSLVGWLATSEQIDSSLWVSLCQHLSLGMK